MAILITGLIAGLVTVVVYYLLERYVFGSVLCRAGNDASCASAPSYAMAVSLVVGTVVGLVGLVQARAYRPLLVVLAVAVSYWGFQDLVASQVWYYGALIGAVLFALSYLLFAWIARLRSFVLSVIVTVLLIVLIRIALVS